MLSDILVYRCCLLQLSEALQWLGERFDPGPDLEVGSLMLVIEYVLTKFYQKPIARNLKKRIHLGRLHQVRE